MRAPSFFRSLCLSIVLLLGAGAAPAVGGADEQELSGPLGHYVRDELPTGALWHPGWEGHRVRWVASLVPGSLERVEARLGRRIEHRFTTVLVDGLPELRRVVRQFGGREVASETLGVALPGRRLIVVRGDAAARASAADQTPVTLVHEIAHLVIHRRLDVEVPRWFDEGVASWVAEGRLAYADEAELCLLARLGGLYELESLRDAFPAAHGPTTFAYRQSHLIVQFLVETRGEAIPGRILDGLESGSSFEAALREATGLDLSALEGEFADWAAGLHPFWLVAISRFDVWALAGPLALWVVLRHWRRRRRQWRRLRAEELDDGGETAGSAPDPTDAAGGAAVSGAPAAEEPDAPNPSRRPPGFAS